eukprot:2616947-Alexandrium_andersonii.AAC.1
MMGPDVLAHLVVLRAGRRAPSAPHGQLAALALVPDRRAHPRVAQEARRRRLCQRPGAGRALVEDEPPSWVNNAGEV